MLGLDIPDSTDESNVADWIEFSVAYDAAPLSKAAVSHKIEGIAGVEPSDAFLSSVWDELEHRMQLYGEYPPYIVHPLEIVPNLDWEENPEYLMCLILALTGNSYNPTPTGKLFERVSKEALKYYLAGDAIVTGHPTQYKTQAICTLTYEGFKSELPANYKDRGVDVIAWKPFNDQRGNQIIVLMQCAGGHNWTAKTGDVIARAWTEKYITFGCPPVRGFSTVVIISDPETFEEISFQTDLLMDRARIYSYVVNKALEENLRNEIKIWCNERLIEILD